MQKNKHLLIILFFLLCVSYNIIAQQGNVVAGGDATGSGGLMSYSIGQTDYLMFTSEQGSLSLGLQQTWLDTYTIPETLEISNKVISEGEILCFNALETVIVAGDGKHFIVEPGGHADIIAGNNILLKHGTRVELGGTLHAYISDIFCNQPGSMLASFEEDTSTYNPESEPITSESFFRVFPNPTTGDFTIELFRFEENSSVQVEVYSAQGHLVLDKILPAQKNHNFSIAGRQPGIYLIRVLRDQEIGTGKIIKQ
jgi:hypothetical protein